MSHPTPDVPDVLPEDTALVLPPCPAVLAGLFEAVQRDHDLREVASLIAADPAICGSVLRTANSVAEAGHTSLRDPLQAVTKLGVRRVLGIACAIAAPGAFPLPPQVAERFWRLSRTTAEAARQVARRIPGPAEEDAYLYGLFRDCGIPLLMLNYPDYEQTVQDAVAENMPSTKLEYFRYGTHHAMVGGLITRHWKMPAELVLSIRHQHDATLFGDNTGSVAPEIRTLAAMGFFASSAARNALGELEDPEWVWCGRQAAAYLGFQPKEAVELVWDVAEAVREVMGRQHLPE